MAEPRQPASRLGRAAGRFNRLMLRLTRPGSSWFLSSVRIFLGAMAVTFPLIVLVLLVERAFGYVGAEPGPARSVAYIVLGIVLFSPFVETALLVLIYKLTWPWLGLTGFVAVNTVLWAVAHIPLQGVPVGAAVLFLVMSYQYAGFREAVGTRLAFWGVFVVHALNNGIAGTAILLAQRFGE